MASKHYFKTKNINYNEYLTIINEMLETKFFFGVPSNISEGIDDLTNINEKDKQERLISCSVLVDKKLHIASVRNGNCSKKIPIITTVATLIANHYDVVANLSDEELMLLGLSSCQVTKKYLEKHLEILACKDLLSAAIKKTDDCFEQSTILSVVKNKYLESSIDQNNSLELDKFKKEWITIIEGSTKEELLSMKKPILETVRELSSKGIRL